MRDPTPIDLLRAVRRIALVGASARPERPSHQVMSFLQQRGYEVIPVNPGLAGTELLGARVYARLADIPGDVDMVDVFRRAEAVPEITRAALARWPDLAVIWMQLGIRHPQASAEAQAHGVAVVQDRCPKIELTRAGL